MKSISINLLVLIIFLLPNYLLGQDLQQVYQNGLLAYEKQDYPSFLQYMKMADSLRPNHPTIMYNLASAFALNKEEQKAIAYLKKSLWQNASPAFNEDEDFKSLWKMQEFETLKESIASLNKTVRNSFQAFTLADPTLHPESIAFHQKSGDYLLGSVHHRKIVKRDKYGNEIDLSGLPELYAVMGIKVDQKRDLLWGCTTAIPEMKGYSETDKDKAVVFCYDLKSEKLKMSIPLNEEGVWLGDLEIARNGTVYISNSGKPIIYKVNEEEKVLETFIEIPNLTSLQGLSFNKKEDQLYLSDYREGLFSIQLKNKKITKLKNPTLHPLKGIDGLYYYKSQLIAIHNGLQPNRVVRYHLDKKGEQVISFEFIDKALPEYGEPTLGMIHKNEFYYIANSPWGAYDDEKQQILAQLEKPLVLKVSLK